jgi:hypothetical protein
MAPKWTSGSATAFPAVQLSLRFIIECIVHNKVIHAVRTEAQERRHRTTLFCAGTHIYPALDANGRTSLVYSIEGSLHVSLTFEGDLEISLCSGLASIITLYIIHLLDINKRHLNLAEVLL